MAEQENFYELLELDPNMNDQAVIDAALQAKKLLWGTQSAQGNPAVRRKAQFNLPRLALIRAEMSDPAKRKIHAVAEVKRRERLRGEAQKKLDDWLDVVRVGGDVGVEQVEQYAKKELAGVLSTEDVLARVRKEGLLGGKSTTRPPPPVKKPRLDATRMDQMRPNLKLLGVKNLYQLLELSPKSSIASLHEAAQAMNGHLVRTGKTDAHSSARKELCGVAISLFGSEPERAKYDGALAVESMGELHPHIEVAGSDAVLSPKEVDIIVQKAGDRGVRPEDAVAYLEEFATKRGWRVQGAASAAVSVVRRCAHCHNVVSADARHCPHCSKALFVRCYRCQTEVAAEFVACPKDGTHIADAPVVQRHLELARERIHDRKYDEAEEALRRALVLWAGWPEAEKLLGEVRAEKSRAESARVQMDALFAARRFTELGAILRRTPLSVEYASTVEDALMRARALLAQANRLHAAGQTDEAADKCDGALEICADLPEAKSLLAAMPPTPPSAAIAEPLPEGFRIQWKGSKGGRNRYTVVRKEHAAPQSISDGTVVGNATALQMDDSRAPGGTPVYYAVYSRRGDVPSLAGAVVGPLLLAVDVKDVEVLPGAAEVTLRWSRPKSALRVEVWRKEGTIAPARGEGTLQVASGDEHQDTQVVVGRTYAYLVVAVFADPLRPNAEVPSRGVAQQASPANPPAPVTDLSARRNGDRVTLSWTPPPGATVQIRRSHASVTTPIGSVVSMSALSRFGALVDSRTPGSAESVIDSQGRTVFLPISVNGGLAVVGAPAAVTTLDDVSSLTSKANGRDILLTWAWPAGAADVIVAYSTERFPTDPNDAAATRTSVSRNAYERVSGCELRNLKPSRHYISVFVCGSEEKLFSSGARVLEPMGQSAVVRYRAKLKKSGLLSRTIVAVWLELECDEQQATLNPLVVRAKDGQPPLGSTDGRLLVELPNVRFSKGKARIDLPLECAGSSTYAKLFFKDSAHAREFRLMPGANDELRLG